MAGLRPYSDVTGPQPHTSLYPVVSEGTWLQKNNYSQFDGWELRQLINYIAVSSDRSVMCYSNKSSSTLIDLDPNHGHEYIDHGHSQLAEFAKL